MNCPDCGSKMPVDQTLPGKDNVLRVHTCDCGSRFTSRQRIEDRLPALRRQSTDKVPVHTGTVRPPPPRGTGPLPTGGGVGGGLSLGPISVSDSDPNQASSKPQIRRTRVKTPPAYTEAFEVEWKLTAKTGSKDKAFAAYQTLGSPDFGLRWLAWERCAEWNRPGYTFPHVASWLNDGRWRQDPTEARPGPALVPALPVKPWVAAEKAEEARKLAARVDFRTAQQELDREMKLAMEGK